MFLKFKGRKREEGESPEIKHINPLFERYKKVLRAPQGSVVKVFCEVAEDEFGFVLKKEWLEYNPHSKTMFIKVSGPQKHELLLRKAQLLKGCQDRLGTESAPKALV